MAGDTDLVKAGVDAILAPVKDFANRLFGPAIDELGGILADPIKIYRFKRSVRLLEKAKRICDETGFEPKAVPLKTLLPILENASLEDDQDLHDRWANLLANAAIQDGSVHPSFTQILQGLTGSEALFLSAIFERISKNKSVHPAEPTATCFGSELVLNCVGYIPRHLDSPRVMRYRLKLPWP